MNKLLSLASMLGVLAIAFGLDRIWELVRQENARTFNAAPSLWLSGILDLAFAASVLSLGWFFLFKSDKSIAISAIFVIIGLLMLFSWPLRGLFPNTSMGFLDRLLGLLLMSATTFVLHAAAFIAVIGLAGLLRSLTDFRAGTRSATATSNV